MAKSVSVSVHVVILCATSMAWAGPVTVFDLRYTLKIDTNDPVGVRMAWDHCHAVAALQGLVNRDAPRLYVRFVDSQHRRRNVDDYWLAKATARGGWLEGGQIREIDNIANLVRRFGGFVRGAVVYDPAVAATSNVASAVAGAEDLLPIRYDTSPESLYSRLVVSGPKLKVVRWLVNRNGASMFRSKGMIPGTQRQSTGSAKCDAYLWMKIHYIRQTATANDYFASADNGAGYCEPGMLQEPRGISNLPSGLDAWARHSKTFYDRWGLSITGFIIYAHGPILNEAGLDCYASFSPNGIVPSGGPANLLHKDMPVLRFDHDVNEGRSEDAAAHVVRRIAQRRKEGPSSR